MHFAKRDVNRAAHAKALCLRAVEVSFGAEDAEVPGELRGVRIRAPIEIPFMTKDELSERERRGDREQKDGL